MKVQVPFFSILVLKKGLQKKLFYPTFLLGVFSLLTWVLLNELIPRDVPGKLSFMLGILMPVSFFNLSLIAVSIKNRLFLNYRELIYHGWGDFQYRGTFSIAIFAIYFSIFLLGLTLYFIGMAPLIGPFLKVIFCFVNFSILCIENLSFGILPFLLFMACCKHIGSIKQLIAQVQFFFERDLDFLKRYLKAVVPLALVFMFLQNIQGQVIEGETALTRLIIKLLLTVPLSAFLTPFVNYAFIIGLKNADRTVT